LLPFILFLENSRTEVEISSQTSLLAASIHDTLLETSSLKQEISAGSQQLFNSTGSQQL
jgi:hypothetical protein